MQAADHRFRNDHGTAARLCGAGVTPKRQPGTGELNAKRLDFIREVAPGDSIIGVLINPKYPTAADQARKLEAAAAKIGRNVFIVEASDDAELKAAFGALLQKRVGALIAVWDPFIELRRQRIIAFAAENLLPDMYQLRDFALYGGLISYAPSITDVHRQVGVYTNHILKRREAIRSTDRAAHEIRAGHQPEDCERSRPQGAAFAPYCRRRGDRIDRLFTAMPFVRKWHSIDQSVGMHRSIFLLELGPLMTRSGPRY
jgi:hypothetical protein